MNIDRNNQRILALLQKDGRMSAAAIGRTIGLSRPAVQERISGMERAGHIRGYHADVPDYVGMVNAILFVKIAESPCDKTLRWLKTLSGVTSVFSIAGEIDAIVSASVPALADLSSLNDRVLESPLIRSMTSTVILRQY